MSDLYYYRFMGWLFSSPPAEFLIAQFRELLIGALGRGPVPQHVAFIMDGNRRYARSHKIETIEGHNRGFETLARILDICYKCGVKAVTVYAFSTENFNRPKYEVDGLMQLAKVKLAQLSQHGELLDRYGASVRILGEKYRIPPDVLEVCDRAVDMTKNNTDAILNICFPYTSREEITTAIRSTVSEYSIPTRPQNTLFSQTRISQKIKSKNLEEPASPAPSKRDLSPASQSNGSDLDDSESTSTTLYSDSPPRHPKVSPVKMVLNPENINTKTLDHHLYTAGCPPLDLLVRTSGVTRLSDFMLWQCHQDTHITFLDCLWPEFDLWQFIPVLMEWQWRQKQKSREQRPRKRSRSVKSPTKFRVE